ncbi:hypothetical protein HXA31_05535 [Salipaludibacillus agaradhaerens]|uniref:Uncharacterized protein n=1 Tax=Salipaludibacillus agaradhaerens TaxID=76935 RepID=A0A9Q4B1J5_SALAG|nr:hypothetical protein [Salipaludibacillus agaradhaerens]MCR6096624.1 hypothetical protein [Salipaludibacillus agaradhaerens]MCR6113817.1 hypothetical protein [Salipaludibacillus agaradhaerens]
MHSKNTVRYFCEVYLSGNKYYFKQEIITNDSWENTDSLYWGKKRPITAKTFNYWKKRGYQCRTVYLYNQPAEIIPFDRSVR